MSKMSSMKSGLKALYRSKFGKLLPVLVIAGMVATASASVFIAYYGSATATVRANDVTLVAGPDATVGTGGCAVTPVYPCDSLTLSSTNDFATIGLSFAASGVNSPQPSTYYTNLLQVHNGGTAAHSVTGVSISTIAGTTADLGSISVYYCTAQTNVPTTTNCAGYSITSTTGGSLSGGVTFPSSLAAGGNAYIEVVAYGSATATAATSVTFQVQINWA